MASTASADPGHSSAMSSMTLSRTKRQDHLWIHQTISLDAQISTPSILIQPSSPQANVYKRTGVNRFRSKSGEEGAKSQITNALAKTSLDERNLTKQTLDEAEQASQGPDVPNLPSPTKRVTFLERVRGQNHCVENANEEKSKKQASSARRVRKSNTADAVVPSMAEKPPPRSPVFEFFNQIRTSSNAPWRSSSASSGISDTVTSASSSSMTRPRAFTLGWRSFANFRQQLLVEKQSQDQRKSSRQSTRSLEKEKRKRTRSYSFRAPTWLNVNKSKNDQSQNSLRPDPQPALKSIIRKRSISANNVNLLIMRQTSSEPEILGSLNRNVDAYREVLSNFSCYDLMPPQGVVVAFDCKFTGRQALQALAKNDARVALLWDSSAGGMIGVLTGTDLLRLLAEHNAVSESDPCQCNGDILDEPLMKSLYECSRSKKTKRPIASIGCEASLRTALSLLIGNRYHRLPVLNSKTGDVVYFLSKKSVLHFLMHHMSTLPTPPSLRRTLADLHLGTWKSGGNADVDEQLIFSVHPTETLKAVAEKFLISCVSALPIFDTDQRLIGCLSKYDLVCFLISAGKEMDFQTVNMEELLRDRRQDSEEMITCEMNTSLRNALMQLVKTNARRIYIVDSAGSFQAIMTISDVLSFLMA